MDSKYQVVMVIALFALIVAGIVLSKFFLKSNIPEPHYERYEQGNRLERIKEGFVDKK
ncbi:MAG: hypothetical protein KKB30_01025 [Proteobacteria bacterium]|nr:hypothetical protein [Pseudomonadota bacterium]MBU1715394.1 hypothetical protein [Pseudomonadota bacterium]